MDPWCYPRLVSCAPCRSGASRELRRTDDLLQVDHQQARDARTRYLLVEWNDVAEH
jgi:hypothetical protein